MLRDSVIFNFHKGFQPLKEAFEHIGYRIIENEWTPDQTVAHSAAACIVNLYEAIRQPWRAVWLKRHLVGAGTPLIGLDRDAPWHMGTRWRRLALFRLLNPLDLRAAHSLQPTHRLANRTIYCPNAAWSGGYNLSGHTLAEMRSPKFYLHDVSFFGNLNGQRYPEHATRAAFINQLAMALDKLEIRYRFVDSAGLSRAEQVRMIQRSRINLNFGAAADHGGKRSWGLPERCYGVPACGGFLLSDERRHAPDDFDPVTEWSSFNDLGDCIDKIRYWLDHFAEMRDIAEAAHERVMKDHTYENRARFLIESAEAFRRGGKES